jgi:glycosyltransferase involved in cell wall biosynthesis
MIKEGFSSTKLHVIYNSLDYKSDILLRNNIQKTTIYKNIFKNEGPILLFIGRLTLVKKLEILLEAQKLLIDSGFICNVIFIGDGEEKDNLKNFILKNDLISFVHFWGESYNNLELSELIYNADLCVSPGNVGLTAIHSLSFGTPVITHNNFTMQMPEFESIIKGVTGDFFEFNSSASLANVIKTWLTKYPRKTSQLIENCYSIIDQKYNPDFQINLLRKLFLQNEKT